MARRLLHYDLTESPKTVADIIEWINEKRYENLDELLKLIEWDLVARELINPKDIRKFTKRITDEEVRLDVMKFLQKYAKQYFREAAEQLEYNDKVENMSSLIREKERTADQYIDLFRQELLFLIDQIENKGQYTGDHVAKLNKRIAELEKQNSKMAEIRQTLIQEIEVLKARIEILEHPERRHQIPDELRCEEFYHIINYLSKCRVVTAKKTEDSYYGVPLYYRWNKSKALFGYFVCKVCYLLELRTRNDHLIWKPFKQAFENFDALEKQARDLASKNKNWEDSFSTKPDEAYLIDDALKYAEEEMALSKNQK